MQILLITDIHANLQGLQAVLERYGNADEVWCLGDIVEYGPSPTECVALARDRCHHIVLGNHDATYASEDEELVANNVWATVRHPDDAEWLRGLPTALTLTIDGLSYYLVHASPQNPLGGTLWPDAETGKFEEALSIAGTDRVLFGHSHMAFIHDIDGRLLVNAGTIGQPRDGDYRAQCMLIEDGAIRFERVDYDLEALRGDYAQSCLPDDIKETWFRYTQQGVVDVHGLQLGPFSAG